jgi:hypothetical protein
VSVDRNSSRLRTGLGLGVLIGLIARTTVFWRGGVGGLVSVAFFPVFATVFVIAAIRYLIRGTDHREKMRWAWGLAAVASFELGVVTDDAAPAASRVFTALTMICVFALLVLGIATLTRRVRGVHP